MLIVHELNVQLRGFWMTDVSSLKIFRTKNMLTAWINNVQLTGFSDDSNLKVYKQSAAVL